MGFLHQETIDLVRQFRASLDRQIDQRVEELLQARLQDARATDHGSIAERLDAARRRLGVSHEAQAARIGVCRRTYFTVKRGGGGKDSILLVEEYLRSVEGKGWRTD
jgi:DNA-binding XRE family transcriptional regulator